jgi:hypothetical protein
LYVYGIDNIVWDSKGSNFVHKRKEMGGTCSKYGAICVQVLVSKLEGKSYLVDPGAEGRIILRWFSRSGVVAWTEFMFFRIRTSEVFIVNIKTEIRILKKCWEFLD